MSAPYVKDIKWYQKLLCIVLAPMFLLIMGASTAAFVLYNTEPFWEWEHAIVPEKEPRG